MSKGTELVKKLIKKCVLFVYHIQTLVLPVNKNIVVFESNLGRNYTGNPRFIYEEMVARGLDQTYQCYFIFDDLNKDIPGDARKIKRMRFEYFYVMAVAGTWVCDSRLPKFIKKRDKVTYIQTWHGTPLKKLALDMEDVSMAGEKNISDYKKNFYNNAKTWDYLISQNPFSTETFRRCFAFDKTMLEIGYPRNDILINKNEESYIIELKKKLGIPLNKKTLLYAPTWRDNEFYGKGEYKFSPNLAFHMLMENLKDDYILLVKYHYLVKDEIDWETYKGFVYDFDYTYDIAELYLVSDMLITDYSSVMFDYSLLRRPMIFYAYDLENYKNNLRGFYFDFIKEAPGPISLTTVDLIDDILNYNAFKYQEKYDAFCNKYNPIDDGMASKKVVDLIISKAQ